MTELERLELVLRRVHSDLSKTSRFAVSDGLLVLKCIIDELSKMNADVNRRQTDVDKTNN